MARTDVHLDAMLRHLGAAYYDSLHGRATRPDVTRALEAVEEQIKARQRQAPGGATATVGIRRIRQADGLPAVRHIPRVRDVMTKKVVTVDRLTPFSEIVRLLTEHRISGVPVLMMGRHVAGVVSEADLLKLEDEEVRRVRVEAQTDGGHWRRPLRKRHWGLTAGALMTAPAVTIQPDATITRAARVMTTHRVRRLPVLGENGRLIGIVTRRDLLSVFLRADAEVAERVRQLLDDLLPVDPGSVTATVRKGVVILTGHPEAPEDRELMPTVIRLIWDVDGVIDVSNRLGEQAAGSTAEPQVAAEQLAGDQPT